MRWKEVPLDSEIFVTATRRIESHPLPQTLLIERLGTLQTD